MVMKYLRRIWFWIIILPLLYLLIGFYALPWAIQTQLPPVLKEKYHLNLSVQEISFNPLTWELHLHQVGLKNPIDETIIGFKHLYIDYALFALLKKTFLIKTFEIDEPFANIRIDSDGGVNIVRLFSAFIPASDEPSLQTQGSKSTLPLSIEHFEIKGAKGSFSDERGEKPFHLDFGPMHYSVNNLHLTQDDLSVHALHFVINNQESLSLISSLSLNPLRLHGELKINQFYLPHIYDYVAPTFAATLSQGYLSAHIPFTIDMSKEIPRLLIEKAGIRIEELSYQDPMSRNVLHISSLDVNEIDFRWPEATLSVNALTLSHPFALVVLEKSYGLNLVNLFTPKTTSTPSAPKKELTFHATLHHLKILDAHIDLIDQNTKGSKTVFSNLFLNTNKLSTDTNESIEYSLSSAIDTQSSLSLKGSFNPKKSLFIADIDAKKIDLTKAQSYLEPYTDISLTKGFFSTHANLSMHFEKALSLLFKGNLAIEGLSINDATKTELLSLNTLSINDMVYATDPQSLHVKNITLLKPYINLDIKKDKTTNFNHLTKEAPNASKKTNASTSQPMEVVIGDVRLKEGSASFKDASLPIPFATRIHNLDGSFSTFNTKSAKPSVLDLQGKVDTFGYAKIGGNLLPLDFKNHSNLKILFKNIDMPSLTPYSGKFVGYAIASGKLSMDLAYKIQQGKMLGDNKINLDSLTLGEKIESEEAINLPLGFAIAVLKDSKGQIDIDLPVSGDLNDPDFKYGAIVWKAIGNLIGSIVTSPFKLIGSLLGIETDTLKSIDFASGEFELIASEEEKMQQYKMILEKKPALKLNITPSFNEALDTRSLQEKALHVTIEKRLKTKEGDDAYSLVLKELFIEKLTKERFETLMAQAASEKLDKGSINESLMAQLAQTILVTQDALEKLAHQRADTILNYLIQNHNISPNRLIKTDLQPSEAIREKWVACAIGVSN